MDKKDIYEHLAKIYLDASSQKRKSENPYSKLYRNFSFISIVLIAGLTVTLLFNVIHKNTKYRSETSLILLPDAAKINFHFDPARKETYSLALNNLNLARYRSLCFSVKKAKPGGLISLRVEFTNSFNEKSEIYFKDIPSKWKDYKINLSAFKYISDWSQMRNLLFVIEEWNTKEKKAVVYIDNVRLLI